MKLIILICIASAALAFPDVTLSRAVEYEGVLGFLMPRRPRLEAPLIVGGSEAPAHAHPHQISLQVRSGNGYYHSCGGSIIEADKIVTAAHCIYGQIATDLRVVAGEHDLFENDGTEQVRAIGSMVYHPRFIPNTLDFDYAVIRLSEPLSLNGNVNTIQLITTEPTSGSCINSGWGNTRGDGGINNPALLQQVTLPIVSRDDCAIKYNGINELTTRMICAGAAGQGPCNGDSGGPLVCGNALAGIVSWGVQPCAQANYPGVYSNIAPAVNWIGLQ